VEAFATEAEEVEEPDVLELEFVPAVTAAAVVEDRLLDPVVDVDVPEEEDVEVTDAADEEDAVVEAEEEAEVELVVAGAAAEEEADEEAVEEVDAAAAAEPVDIRTAAVSPPAAPEATQVPATVLEGL